jgi:thiol:disulfide interchange protein
MKIIKFSAIWCIECIVARPIWLEITEQFPNLEIVEYDADEDTEKMEEWAVKDIPAYIFLDKAGQEISRVKGLNKKNDFINLIKDNIDK